MEELRKQIKKLTSENRKLVLENQNLLKTGKQEINKFAALNFVLTQHHQKLKEKIKKMKDMPVYKFRLGHSTGAIESGFCFDLTEAANSIFPDYVDAKLKGIQIHTVKWGHSLNYDGCSCSCGDRKCNAKKKDEKVSSKYTILKSDTLTVKNKKVMMLYKDMKLAIFDIHIDEVEQNDWSSFFVRTIDKIVDLF